jgi:hypothetical protein
LLTVLNLPIARFSIGKGESDVREQAPEINILERITSLSAGARYLHILLGVPEG